jgi:hypothetical protein
MVLAEQEHQVKDMVEELQICQIMPVAVVAVPVLLVQILHHQALVQVEMDFVQVFPDQIIQ